jgi:hypothetical protein
MFGTEHAPPPFKGLASERRGLGEVVLFPALHRQAVEAGERVRVVLAEVFEADCMCPLQVRVGRFKLPQVPVR